MLLGPLVGLALLTADFRAVCAAAAAIFAVLTLLQWRTLPARRGDSANKDDATAGVLAQWRTVVSNRPFLLFSTAMIGSYVLTFQVYLALPSPPTRPWEPTGPRSPAGCSSSPQLSPSPGNYT